MIRSLVLSLSLAAAGVGHADSVAQKASDTSPEAERKSFTVHEDFEVSLFADETLGIANPVAMHWDHKGRLWVLTTLTYAQLEPGENPNDTLVILEDRDGDGKADKSTVFVDGLNMPMGFALGHGGVYVGEGPDLLFFRDTDGDDRADTREVVLTGFGTGDTHQNISNFTWGPDGRLYFAQGLHAYSAVETPWGIVRGDTAGFFRFDPVTLRLEPFCFPALASQNPCGIVFDKTGALFVKSNNRELIYTTPGLIPTTHQKDLVPIASIGSTPGKSMGGEYVDSANLPDWLQDHILIAGYYSNRVSAFELVEDGAGYAPVEHVELLVSDHSSFRPVEIRVGPDGAIYIADWFNPIIGHYQASLRHPDRDKRHGRVWRMTAKGRDLLDRADWKMPETVPLTEAPSVEEIRTMIGAGEPRKRLDGIVAAANHGGAEAMALALKALDAPTDRFIDYSLEQTVHALAADWIPAIAEGKVDFEKPEHLGYALKTLGGEEALGIARARLKGEGMSDEARRQMAAVMASSGTADDLLALVRDPKLDAAVLAEMADAWARRKVKPAGDVVPRLRELISSGDSAIRLQAVRLAGLWQAKAIAPEVKAILTSPQETAEWRAEAARSLARLEGEAALPLLVVELEKGDLSLRPALVDAMASVAPIRAAKAAAPLLGKAESVEAAIELLRPFLNRKGASDHLAAALEKTPLSAQSAEFAVGAMSQLGRSDEKLMATIQSAMGIVAGAVAYSPDYVKALAEEVAKSGNPEAGKEIYHRAQLTCVACHQLGGVGGIIGPSLDAVGAGLPADLLIESVLWPDRQLKEGYFSIAVTTKGGDTYSGYRDKDESGYIYLRDTASGEVKPIQKAEITKLDNIGTLMPPGLTNGLSREELRDLIAYLATLKG